MALFNFLGQSYPAISTNLNASRAINFIPEINPSDSATPLSLIGTPGTLLFCTFGLNPVRGAHVASNGLMYVVSGNKLYSIDGSGTISAALGTLATSTGRVDMADNGVAAAGIGGNQVMIVDGAHGYLWNFLTSAFTTISGGGWPSTGAARVTFIDGYFVISTTGSMSFCVSDLYDGSTWNALATAPVQGNPDLLQVPINVHNQLWLIKQYSSEIYYNAGIATSAGCPFARLSGAVIDYGTPAQFSPALGDNSLFFLATQKNNNTGQVVGIVELSGYTPSIVSPPAINYQISKMKQISDAWGYCYSDIGHTFYVLTFPTEDVTYVYDAATKLCHERSSYKISGVTPHNDLSPGRHVGNSYAFYNGKHYLGDFQNGNIYEMSMNYFTDNGYPIVSTRVAQPLAIPELSQNSMLSQVENLFFKTLFVEAETGVGDGGLLVQTGIDPQAFLSWSDDGGHTWSNEYPCSLGAAGKYRNRLKWRRLGVAKSRTFKLKIDAPVKKVLLNGFLEVHT